MGAVKKVQLNTASRLPSQQAEDEVEGADAGGQKQRADHQFRARDVLARELADVVLQPEQGLLRHRLALVFVYRVAVTRLRSFVDQEI